MRYEVVIGPRWCMVSKPGMRACPYVAVSVGPTSSTAAIAWGQGPLWSQPKGDGESPALATAFGWRP